MRAKCIEKNSQLEFCHKFEDCMKYFLIKVISRSRIIFTRKQLEIDYFIKNQNNLMFGEELKKYQFTPKLLYCIFNKIISMKQQNLFDNLTLYNNFYFIKNWDEVNEVKLAELKVKLIIISEKNK